MTTTTRRNTDGKHRDSGTSSTDYLLEICVDSLESAENAVEGGADRLELCGCLQLGGLTPTAGLLSEVLRRHPNTPVYCMLRCRDGSFVYDEREMACMMADLKALKHLGAHGFVFGALAENGDVEESYCKRILDAATPLPVTFHRAFDVSADWQSALSTIETLGFTGLLTSGQANTAVEGIDLIDECCRSSSINVMAGSGVNPDNAAQFLSAGLKHLHASASVKVPIAKNAVQMGFESSTTKTVTQAEKVRAIKTQMLQFQSA